LQYDNKGVLVVNRNLETPFQKVSSAFHAALMIIINLTKGNITFKQAYFEIDKALIHRPKLNDDFDWARYHLHYGEELKSGERKHTLTPQIGDYMLIDGELQKINANTKPLHPNHKLLYEAILNINPKSILEVGCGGGDHLSNIVLFNADIEVSGVDRSIDQIAILKDRHPSLKVSLDIVDITVPGIQLPAVELVFSQAVLMHISEDGNRFQNAMNNIFSSASSYVVLMENWRHHDFLNAAKKSAQSNPHWATPFFYFAELADDPKTRAMVISRMPLNLRMVENYDDFLFGSSLRVH
jgi:trans-aconitate methyltransferase